MPFDATTLNETAAEQLPMYRPRRNQVRLDFRPVIWSLRNRPEEWEWRHRPYTLRHKPSDHTFWVANGTMFYNLDARTRCSCSGRDDSARPPWRDRVRFHWAFKAWRRAADNTADINRQFAAHFLTPRA